MRYSIKHMEIDYVFTVTFNLKVTRWNLEKEHEHLISLFHT